MTRALRRGLALLPPFLLAFSAHADQQAWVARRDADRAAALLPVGASVRLYCAPCGDPAPTAVRLERVEVVATGHQDLWEVRVNGEGIDLAYTYVERAGHWEDLALLLGLEAREVPRFLDDDKTGPAATAPTPAEELSAAEKEMGGLVDGLFKSLPPPSAPKLRRAQDAWQQYRDAQADLEASLSADPATETAARLHLTRGRMAELARLGGG